MNRAAALVGVGAVGDAEADFAPGELTKVGDVARGDDFDRFAAELGDVRRALAPRCARLRVGDQRVERRDGEIGAVAFDGGAERGGRDAAGDDLTAGAAGLHRRDEVARQPRSRRRRSDRRARRNCSGSGFGGVGAATLWPWSLAPGV